MCVAAPVTTQFGVHVLPPPPSGSARIRTSRQPVEQPNRAADRTNCRAAVPWSRWLGPGHRSSGGGSTRLPPPPPSSNGQSSSGQAGSSQGGGGSNQLPPQSATPNVVAGSTITIQVVAEGARWPARAELHWDSNGYGHHFGGSDRERARDAFDHQRHRHVPGGGGHRGGHGDVHHHG